MVYVPQMFGDKANESLNHHLIRETSSITEQANKISKVYEDHRKIFEAAGVGKYISGCIAATAAVKAHRHAKRYVEKSLEAAYAKLAQNMMNAGLPDDVVSNARKYHELIQERTTASPARQVAIGRELKNVKSTLVRNINALPMEIPVDIDNAVTHALSHPGTKGANVNAAIKSISVSTEPALAKARARINNIPDSLSGQARINAYKEILGEVSTQKAYRNACASQQAMIKDYNMLLKADGRIKVTSLTSKEAKGLVDIFNHNALAARVQQLNANPNARAGRIKRIFSKPARWLGKAGSAAAAVTILLVMAEQYGVKFNPEQEDAVFALFEQLEGQLNITEVNDLDMPLEERQTMVDWAIATSPEGSQDRAFFKELKDKYHYNYGAYLQEHGPQEAVSNENILTQTWIDAKNRVAYSNANARFYEQLRPLYQQGQQKMQNDTQTAENVLNLLQVNSGSSAQDNLAVAPEPTIQSTLRSSAQGFVDGEDNVARTDDTRTIA